MFVQAVFDLVHIPPTNLDQFSKSWTVLKYACSEVSKTVPDFENLPRIVGDIFGQTHCRFLTVSTKLL